MKITAWHISYSIAQITQIYLAFGSHMMPRIPCISNTIIIQEHSVTFHLPRTLADGQAIHNSTDYYYYPSKLHPGLSGANQ